MKEPYIEGPATHDSPESCAGTREGAGEALTGEDAGRVLHPWPEERFDVRTRGKSPVR